jgi:hypothetical protein
MAANICLQNKNAAQPDRTAESRSIFLKRILFQSELSTVGC